MRICIVSDFFIPHYQGGGERRYYEIARRLVKKGHQVDVICMRIDGANDQEEIEGIKIHHIGPIIYNPPHRSLYEFICFIYAVFKWIITHDYDIIDAQAYTPLIPAFLGAKLKRTPIVGTIHDVSADGDDQWIQSSKIAAIAEKILVRLPYDKILSVSNATKKSLVEYYSVDENRISVVYAGVDLELIDSVEIKDKVKNSIIFVGRLAPHKHVDNIIEVVDKLKDKIPNIKLTIVGHGMEKNKLINLVDSKGLTDHVDFMENLEYSEVIMQIKKSSLLVLPSTREGFGMVLAEANACKVPVVAYKSGGVVEVVENGVNGFLVEKMNLIELSDKILFLLQNSKTSKKMEINGRLKVEKYFNWDKIYLEYEKVLVRLNG